MTIRETKKKAVGTMVKSKPPPTEGGRKKKGRGIHF
jgi:hypothetical protein